MLRSIVLGWILRHGNWFDKLCRATQLWHGSDSNIVPLPCQTNSYSIYVFWRDCFRAGRYEETTRRILLYRVCALNVTRSDIRSENTVALQTALNLKLQQTINLKVALYTRNVFFSFYKCSNHPYLYRGSRRQDWTAKEFSEENKIVVRKQSCNNSTRLACKVWSIFCRLPFLLLLKSCNN